jgi:hypothetical protein
VPLDITAADHRRGQFNPRLAGNPQRFCRHAAFFSQHKEPTLPATPIPNCVTPLRVLANTMAPSKQHPDLLVSLSSLLPHCPAQADVFDAACSSQSCNFNQDFSCVSVGTRKGYSIVNCDPFGKIYSKCEATHFDRRGVCRKQPWYGLLTATRCCVDASPADGPTAIVEMLFCTSLVALVGAADNKSSSASPRRLQIVNTKVSLDLAGPHYSEIVLNCDKRLAPSP